MKRAELDSIRFLPACVPSTSVQSRKARRLQLGVAKPSSSLVGDERPLRVDAASSRPWSVHSGRPQSDGGADGPVLSSGRAVALADRARQRLLTTRQFSSPVAGAVAARTEEFVALG
jgi:hypothetical protein